jgi:hypothetical protein
MWVVYLAAEVRACLLQVHGAEALSLFYSYVAEAKKFLREL